MNNVQQHSIKQALKTLSLILAFGLLTGLLSGCAKPQPDMLIIDNVQGYSFDNDRQLFEFSALAVSEGRVVQTGDATLAAQYPEAKIHDGQGKTLLPGLIDAHGHISSLGYAL
ncbi:hypothetical protein OAI19_02350, partial [Porticoccaceae bacterium]|nr:hypothetical protein [Porticoccaceae bacterium]